MRLSSVFAACAVLRSSTALNITVSRPNETFVPGNKLPASHATSDGASIVELFTNIGRSTAWKVVSKTRFEGDTGEPEGMVRIGDDRFFVSAGQWTVPTVHYNRTINGTDRTAGAGYAHMLVYDGQGNRIANATLTAPGDIEYHGGGIDYDGRYIWITLAQYRPNTTATITRIDPLTLEQTRLFRTADHNGGIVHDTITDNLVTLNWGSRNATTWSLKNYPHGFTPLPGFTAPDTAMPNPSFFTDYQDCKFLGHHLPPSSILQQSSINIENTKRPLMLCGGVATISDYNLGGLALVDLQTMLPVWEVPMSLTSDLGTPLTQNPVDVAVVDGKLRVYCLPDQHVSTLYVIEAA
ncbi:hypothetical protein DTO021D3_9094 [Paecilomyces variotii]|nr:hypothetical protein DTO032I3_1731 [Paecilomyces variotii]KAJ9266032.1 hypothetical protein DTO212C5_6471 [Paecilomyces variotii]KAJ9274057.1 hypothetical protein DTO021D3_9094 [Paecilomyces variotii]KAJ9345481.1 hypothetical protein DTO027B6_2012 [Paecilomyces variotii]KAJ9386032.1 hypothetical protein DTO032I4_3763 [Paecilomyces variotii]